MDNAPTQPGRQRKMRRLVRGLDVLLAVAALAAAAALVLEYGFRRPPIPARYLHLVEAAIMLVFVLDRLARLIIAPQRARYLRENPVDFLLMAAAAAAVAVSFKMVLSAGALYVIITHVYLLAVLVIRGVNLNLRFAGSGIHPSWLLIGSFLFMIVVGSGLLMLPISVKSEYYHNWSYLDALFTSTSATCVTGLVLVNTGDQFTGFGQAVILALIQCGGLGIMLFGTVLGLLVGKALTMRQSETLGHMVAANGAGRLARVAAFVIVSTFAFELIGAILLRPMFAGQLDTNGVPLSQAGAIWYSVFHSISSFCNAGFALYGDNMMQGVRQGWSHPLRNNWQIMGVMAPLIVLGGIGFPVLANCARWATGLARRAAYRISRRQSVLPSSPPRHRLSLHTKIVLTVSASLIVLGAVLLLAVEPRQVPAARIGRHVLAGPEARQVDDWSAMTTGQRVRQAVFQSVTARTAGFNTIDMAELSNAGKLSMCALMIVGGSPASTAGGMKTVTVALLVLVVIGQLRRRREVEVFKRSIPAAVVSRAVALALLYLALVGTVTMGLCVVQGPGFKFVDLLFEASSACGTVGLSTGVTKSLSYSGKWVIIAGMFIGRLGPLTLLAAIASRLRPLEYAYPAEQVIIG